jgi:hypothetical protein
MPHKLTFPFLDNTFVYNIQVYPLLFDVLDSPMCISGLSFSFSRSYITTTHTFTKLWICIGRSWSHWWHHWLAIERGIPTSRFLCSTPIWAAHVSVRVAVCFVLYVSHEVHHRKHAHNKGGTTLAFSQIRCPFRTPTYRGVAGTQQTFIHTHLQCLQMHVWWWRNTTDSWGS